MKMQRTEMKSGRKNKKAVNRKVGYDKAFMIDLVKEGKFQGKPHCDLEHTRSKEINLSTSMYFREG
jgi:hypothetical protein